jgi:hypothetical protein
MVGLKFENKLMNLSYKVKTFIWVAQNWFRKSIRQNVTFLHGKLLAT